MKTVNSVDWRLLLETSTCVTNVMQRWSTGSLSTREASSQLAHTSYAGEFRRLVRGNGTTYGRRLARKAFNYRGVPTL